MKITAAVIKNAVRLHDELSYVKEWTGWGTLMIPMSKHQAFAAMRFLIENGLVDSRIAGSGTERRKEYRTHKPGLTVMADLDSVTVSA